MISIKEAFAQSWKVYKEHTELFIFTTLLILVVNFFSDADFPIGVLASIFSLIINIGYTKIFLRVNEGEKPIFSDIFSQLSLFWKYLGLSILYMIMVVVGTILLIVPGVIFLVRLSLAFVIMVDTKVGPVQALKESWAITKGSFWKLFGFTLVVIILNIAGAFALVVGLLLTVPLSVYASVLVYRSLTSSRATLMVEPVVEPSPTTSQ